MLFHGSREKAYWQHWNYRAMHSGSGTICVLPLYLCGISSVSGRPDGMSGKK